MIPVNASSLGRLTGFAPPIARRRPVAQHLAHGVARNPKAPRRRPFAQPLDKDAASNLNVELHPIHPSRVPQNTPGMLADHVSGLLLRLLTEPSSTPLSWPSLSPAFSLLLAEGHLNRKLFGEMLARLAVLPAPGG